MDLLRLFEKEQTKTLERPQLKAGDSVRVTMKIKEGEKERLQTFEGTVISLRGSGPSVTFTVRREVGRFAIERIFPLYSPLITEIDITKRQKVRRAKLSYLREAGRRRVKEDLKAMQRHRAQEEEKKRVAEAQAKKAAEEKAAAEEAAKKEAEAQAKEKEKPEAAPEQSETPQADKKDE